MSEDKPATPEDDADREGGGITRRRMLLGGGASLGILGGGRAVYNTILGYGQFGMGTNLKEQDITAVATDRLLPRYDETIDGTRIRSTTSGIEIDGEERLHFEADDREDATQLDAEFGSEGRITELFADLPSLQNDEFAFELFQPADFFERIEEADTRPELVTAIRNNWDRDVNPAIVEQFTGAEPTDPVALIDGLTAGFREHTRYDIPRYLAGSIEDNVILGARDLRAHFEDDVGFEALLEADTTGIFCWELVFRSIEALQSVRADQQSVPVAACYVSDRRHKHAFTGILSAIREDGELRFPMTFVDYTYSTLYDDFRLTGALGEGVAAYDDSHRADEIYW